MKTWKTKSGAILKIKDMSTIHIKNCVKMLERDYTDKCNQKALDCLAACCGGSSDMASYYGEQDYWDHTTEAIEHKHIFNVFGVYQDLIDELQKRK